MTDTITASIQYIDYYDTDSGFSICAAISRSGEPFRAVGHFSERHEFADCRFIGHWESTAHHPQFCFTEYTISPPEDTQQLTNYLQSKTRLPKGICKLLAEQFNTDLFRLIDTDPQQLKHPGVSDDHIQTLCDVFSQQDGYEKARQLLQSADIPLNSLKTLHRALGHDQDLTSRIRANPYLLYYHCHDVSIAAAKRIADYFQIAIDDRVSLAALTLHTLRTQQRQHAHSGLPIDLLCNQLNQRLPQAKITKEDIKDFINHELNDVVMLCDGLVGDRNLLDYQEQLQRCIEKRLSISGLSPSFSTSPEQIIHLSGCDKQVASLINKVLENNVICISLSTYDRPYRWINTLLYVFLAHHAELVVLTPYHEQLQQLQYFLSQCSAQLTEHWINSCRSDEDTGSEAVDLEVIILPFINHYSTSQLLKLFKAIPNDCQIIMLGNPSGGNHPDDGNWLRDFPLLEMSMLKTPTIAAPEYCAYKNKESTIQWMQCDWDELYTHIGPLYQAMSEKGETIIAVIDAAVSVEGKQEKLNRLLHYQLCQQLGLKPLSISNRTLFVGERVMFTRSIRQKDIPIYTRGSIKEISDDGLVVHVNGEDITLNEIDIDAIIPAFVVPVRWLFHGGAKQIILCVHPDQTKALNRNLIDLLYQAVTEQVLIIGAVDQNCISKTPSNDTQRYTRFNFNIDKDHLSLEAAS